jgi:hypothetical protein
MSRQDYKLMASYFAQELTKDNKRVILILIGAFCQIAKRDNPNFDEEKFKLACGL